MTEPSEEPIPSPVGATQRPRPAVAGLLRQVLRRDRLFGTPPFDRLAHTHGLITGADAFFGVSLAGSLFFSVSVDAARPRILLYLLVTMAPFAVLAPLIGPFVDRLPGGQRALIAATCAGRGLVCLNLAGELQTLAFYPLAFTILVLGKTYSVAKNALVPRLVDDPVALVASNSRLSRLATYAGSLSALVGVALLDVTDAPWALRVAGVIYLVAAGVALRLPRPPRSTRSAATGLEHIRAVEREELHGADLRRAASAMGALRGAVGFVIFLLAMGLKRSGDPAWFFGAVFAAHAVGGFAGTFVAPRVRRSAREEHLLAAALVLVSAVALFASLGPGRILVTTVAAVLGTSANAGRQAFDSLVQRDAPDVERGRLFARFETRFQLSWVLGALIAVAAQPPVWAGFLLVGAVTGAAALSYVVGRPIRPDGAEGGRAKPRSQLAVPPALQLLDTAERLAAHGDLGAAVIVAAAAVDATARASALGDTGSGSPPGHLDVTAELQTLRRSVLDGEVLSAEGAARAIGLARSLVAPPARTPDP